MEVDTQKQKHNFAKSEMFLAGAFQCKYTPLN